ncbi:DNA ligase 1 [Vanessa cardui]|uniref:DNA ligase 1 n=1 Tax=Vanessa cardui TaxID=171605 RepID=UPI001F14278D|nr:DNA ligase 1 [Vanessa cardui]
MNILKLINRCRLVISIPTQPLSRTLNNKTYKQIVERPNVYVNIPLRNMSQKSITSFFKSTPKKTEEKINKDDSISSLNNSSEVNGTSANENGKRSKRLRSSSSESKSPETEKKSPPVKSEKKKKVKRQRIDSSESESESPTKPIEEQSDIKLERSNNPPKTYDSPKSKKSKKQENIVSEKKIKVEKTSPKTPKKKEVKSKESPLNKFMVKVEKSEDSETKNNKENIKNDEEKPEVVAEIDYNPAKPKYHPIKDACWSKGEAVPYLALAKTLEVIEGTSARLKMVEILSNYFRSVIALTPEDLLASIYLCLNKLAPAYHSLELGIAETYLMKAVGQCTGRTLAQMRSAAQRSGDLGLVAEQARATQRTMFAAPKLLARRVLAALRDVAAMSGQASVNKKIGKIQSLYVACRHSEARYLIRSLEGKLRVGLAEQSVLQALALACASTPPQAAGSQLDVASTMSPEAFKALVDEHALTIKTTYCECPNYELIVPVLLRAGVAALPLHCKLTPGIPLKPMLAHPSRGVHEVFTRFENEEFTCEYKYDGERAQIHVPGDAAPRFADAAVFSRNQENNTSKYPDVLRRLPALLQDSVTSCVLDCEAVAYDTETKQILPFQVLSTRKRKDAAEGQIKVQVCVFVFDLLYLNGRALVRSALAERRALLREHFREVPGQWQFAEGGDCSDEESVQRLLENAIQSSCEGLMLKALHGPRARYDIARRSHNWLKLKKDYLEGVGDTIDAVVLGAYRGRGKRAGLYGGFLLGCRDADADHYQSLCKIGTGFSDEDLRSLTDALAQHVIDAPRSYYMFDGAHAADVWFSAAAVWEVRCADLSLSPAHRAAIGLVDPERGISLRFPRFVRVRDDKTPEQATSAEQLAQMYLAQDQVKNIAQKHVDQDDFY